jgi:hypothetical protein
MMTCVIHVTPSMRRWVVGGNPHRSSNKKGRPKAPAHDQQIPERLSGWISWHVGPVRKVTVVLPNPLHSTSRSHGFENVSASVAKRNAILTKEVRVGPCAMKKGARSRPGVAIAQEHPLYSSGRDRRAACRVPGRTACRWRPSRTCRPQNGQAPRIEAQFKL